MASPQAEEGYTRIANDLLEALVSFPFSKRQYKVLLHVVRKTYGFNKKSDDMTVTQIAKATGLDRAHASRALDELEAIGAVLKQHGKHGYVIGLVKNYDKWNPVPKQHARAKTARTPCQNSTETVPKQHTQKTTPKDNPQKTVGSISIDTYMEKCKQADVKPVPADDAVFKYAEDVGIPVEFLRLCWREFVERNRDRGKRYKDWRKAFRNCVRDNWFRLWWVNADGEYQLTTAGVQAQKRDRAAQQEKAA